MNYRSNEYLVEREYYMTSPLCCTESNKSNKTICDELASRPWFRSHQALARMHEFLATLPATLAVTLRYASAPITADQIRHDLRDMHAKVDRRLYGRDFHRSPTRSSYWAVVETLDTNPHAQVGWYFPRDADARTLDDLLRDGLWQRRYAMGGTHDVQPHRSGWAGYACKALRTTDHVILSTEPSILEPE
jgi:hypothetical protein